MWKTLIFCAGIVIAAAGCPVAVADPPGEYCIVIAPGDVPPVVVNPDGCEIPRIPPNGP